MTTIGYATLQIIPSLRGVSEAITKELEGQTIEVAVDPKVDQAAAKKAGKEAGDTIVKETKDAVSKGDVGKVIAEDVKKSTTGVGRQAGDKIAKETKDAVRKGDIGKEVAEDVKESVEKAGPGREIAKVIVDGLADGMKQGLPKGGVGEVIVDGIAEGVKKGIDSKGLGTDIVGSITNSIKSGDLTGKLKDSVVPGLQGIGDLLKSGAGEWSTGIAEALRTGDINGATTEISDKVKTTTDTIAGIGELFGLQTDDIRQWGDDASTLIGGVNDAAEPLKTAMSVVGEDISDLPNKTSKAVGLMNKAFAAIEIAQIGEQVNMQIRAALEKNFPKLAELNDSSTPDQLGAQFREWLIGNGGAAPNRTAPQPTTNGIPDSQLYAPATTRDTGGVPVLIDPITKLPINQSDRPRRANGGQIVGPGTGRSDSILARVSNGEYVVNADATQKHLSLLEAINKGRIPAFAGGGLVAGTSELRDIIMKQFGIADIGGYRPADKYGEHSTGRALDVMVGNNKSKGDAVKDFALKNADAIDLKWVIWRQHLYRADGSGYDMEDRGNPTQNHMDHVHIFSGAGIANGIRGSLKGAAPDNSAMLAALGGPGAIDPTSTDQSGAAPPPKTPAAPSGGGGGGVSIPSSLSGLSTFGLSNLGVTTQVAPNTPQRTLDIGGVADAAIGGQVSSALGVLGVGNSPPWLQAASKLISGIKVSDSSGNSLFDGGNILGSLAPGAGGVVPASADATHGARAGQQPGPVYNIQTAKVEDAFLQARRIENEKAAAKLSRF